MISETREFYQSPNGERWCLARDAESGQAFVVHEAGPPSGRQVINIEIGVFLNGVEQRPEHHGLLRLIGTLVEDTARGDRT